MDSDGLTENRGSAEARSEDVAASVGEKRPAENGEGEDGELGAPQPKKARKVVGDVKKVAEIVLVLAAMGKMRGGRNPTAAEREMMNEARAKLAQVCEEFAPSEVFPKDAFAAVMEDLGLNKVTDQKLGFRPSKISIAEKLLFSKQKMEKSAQLESRQLALNAAQRLQTNTGAAAEIRPPSHTTRVFPSDKQTHAPIASGGYQPASSLGHIPSRNPTSLPYQLPASEIRSSAGTSGLPTSILGRDSSSTASPGIERQQFRPDARANGPAYVPPQVQVNSSSELNVPTWSQQPQSTSSGKTRPDNKLSSQPTVKVEGSVNATTSRMAHQAPTSKPLLTQTASAHQPTMHPHVQGVMFSKAPLVSNVHNEICKIVQKLLYPQLPQHPTWTPPSREYMTKSVACQVCKINITELENVLVCDACEKGYHMKCLQVHNQKGVPRSEWHCFKCLSLTNGKPLPPKYGRVTRNVNTPKMPSSSVSVQSATEKKVGTSIQKVSQQKIVANGSSGLETPPVGSFGNDDNDTASSNMTSGRELQARKVLASREKMDDKHPFESCSDESTKLSGRKCVASAEPYKEDMALKLKAESSAKPAEVFTKVLDNLQPSSNSEDTRKTSLPCDTGDSSQQFHRNNLTLKDSEKKDTLKPSENSSSVNIKLEQGVEMCQPLQTSDVNGTAKEHDRQSSDGSGDVDWTGQMLEVVDEKTYYSSCSIKGIVYKLQDHALVSSGSEKLMPAKIQAMWEDNKTRSKWVRANRCYFPGDLPEAVGRPLSPEINEVYESNHGSTLMISLIQGPCEVLPPGKYIEEKGRRSCGGREANDARRPLFKCKWFYDEQKGVFRDVTC